MLEPEMMQLYSLSLIQSFAYSYFLSQYLYSKNPIRKFFECFMAFALIFHPLSLLLYHQYFLKGMITFPLYFVIIFICFKENSFSKKILSFILLFLIPLFIEFFNASIQFLVNGTIITDTYVYPDWVYFFFSVAMIIGYAIELHILKKKSFFTNNENIYFLLMCFGIAAQFYMASFIFIYMEVSFFMLSVIVFILLTLFHGILFYKMIKDKQKEQERLTILMLQDEYKKQLEFYIDNKEQLNQMRQLRHDLINYMQAYKQK